MRKHWLAYSLAGVLLYVIFLTATVPATFFANRLAQVTKGVFSLNDVTGSIWAGEGQVVLHAAPKPPTALGQGKWSMNPFGLVLGRAQVALDLAGSTTEAHAALDLGLSTTRLSNLDIRFPATFAETFYTPAMLIGPAGDVRLTAPTLEIARDGIIGSAEIQWLNASSLVSSVKPLGDYRLQFSAESKVVKLKLETLKGDLRIDGDGQYRVEAKQLQLNLGVKPSGRAEELEPLLKLLGPDQGQGERKVALTAPFNLF